jgi:rare lipoprotein A
MKSHGSALAALLLAGCAGNALPPAPQQPPAGSVGLPEGGEPAAPEARYDAVGWAGAAPSVADVGEVFVVHPTLPAGSFVELTLLDTGRTIVARVGQQAPVAPGYLLTLSPVAAEAFGVGKAPVAVRVREAVPAPQERAAAAGGSLTRMDAPQVLLAALRKRLPPGPAGAPLPMSAARPASSPMSGPGPQPIATVDLPPSQVSPLPMAANAPAAPEPKPVLAKPVTGGWAVQVAALSNPSRAEALARELGGFTVRTGALVRVRMGPYPTSATAERGRAQAAARGYGDAKVIRND